MPPLARISAGERVDNKEENLETVNAEGSQRQSGKKANESQLADRFFVTNQWRDTLLQPA